MCITISGGYPPDHNLEGGLVQGFSVCEGYAKILHEALNMVGIDSKIILGYSTHSCDDNDHPWNQIEDNGHAWNQVKINGTWYNTDLTWDTNYLRNFSFPDFCLRSDIDFISHFPLFNTERCRNNYSNRKIIKYLKPIYTKELDELNSLFDNSATLFSADYTPPISKLKLYEPSIFSIIITSLKKFFHEMKGKSNETTKKIENDESNFKDTIKIDDEKTYDDLAKFFESQINTYNDLNTNKTLKNDETQKDDTNLDEEMMK